MVEAEEAPGGFISIHRVIRDWPVWKSLRGEQRAVVIEILLIANWKTDWMWDGKERVEIRRGEFAHSLETIAEGAGVGIRVVRTVIRHLLSDGFLTQRSTRLFRVLSVVNYDKWQSPREKTTRQPTQTRHGVDTDPTPREQGEQVEQVTTLSGSLRVPTLADTERVLSSPGPEGPTPAKPKAKKTPNPRHTPMRGRLGAAFRDCRNGAEMAWNGAEAKALDRLLDMGSDDEIERRWRLGLKTPGYRGCNSLTELSNPGRWNGLAGTGPPAGKPSVVAPPSRDFSGPNPF